MSPNSKGCCSEARTGETEKKERRTVDSVNGNVPRIVSAPHAIDTSRRRVSLSGRLVVDNRVPLMSTAQSGIG